MLKTFYIYLVRFYLCDYRVLAKRNFKIMSYYFGAQCSPRHACTLKGSLLMQMHKQSQAAPELALTRAAGV
jgi:hypothetical protein